MRSLAVAASIAVFAGLAGVNDASAAGQRSFVSAGGADVGTCTLTAPCRTFAYAIGQTAAKGEVIALDSGGYGVVSITKSITLSAPPGVYAGISATSGDAVVISAIAGNKVTLHGLTVNDQGSALSGIVVAGAALTHVERCVISGFDRGIEYNVASGSAVIVSDSTLRDNQLGIDATGSGSSGRLEVVRSYFHGNSQAIQLTNVNRASIVDSHFARNTWAIGADNTAAATEYTSLVIDRTAVVENSNTGVSALGSATALAMVNITNSTVAGNSVGIQASISGYIRVAGTQITGNTYGIDAFGSGVMATLGTNMLYGNGSNGAFTISLPPK